VKSGVAQQIDISQVPPTASFSVPFVVVEDKLKPTGVIERLRFLLWPKYHHNTTTVEEYAFEENFLTQEQYVATSIGKAGAICFDATAPPPDAKLASLFIVVITRPGGLLFF